jgi:hypothetical protein
MYRKILDNIEKYRYANSLSYQCHEHTKINSLVADISKYNLQHFIASIISLS